MSIENSMANAQPTGTNKNGLLPCPFCGGAVQPRDALWPSEGDSDAVIHAAPTDCPISIFSNGSTDKSIYALWNRRPPGPSALKSAELLGTPSALVEHVARSLFGPQNSVWDRRWHDLHDSGLRYQSWSGSEPTESKAFYRAQAQRVVDSIKLRIDARLDHHLCEMQEGYDDSVAGFNEAWDVVRAIFAQELKPMSEKPWRHPPGCPDSDWCSGHGVCYWDCQGDPDADLARRWR